MANCPTLLSITGTEICEENFAGLGSTAYLFAKEDLASALSTKADAPNVFSWTDDSFDTGKHFYKVELKESSESITGESSGKNKGFKQTAQLVIEVVNEETSKLCRALNNIDWAFVIPDGDKYQIMYSPTKKLTLDAGAFKTETGAQASDDRVVTIAPVLENCKYPNNYVEFPASKSPDSYLA